MDMGFELTLVIVHAWEHDWVVNPPGLATNTCNELLINDWLNNMLL